MSWLPVHIKVWKNIAGHVYPGNSIIPCVYRCNQWDTSDLRGRVFQWASGKANHACKNWWYYIKESLMKIGVSPNLYMCNNVSKDSLVSEVVSKFNDNYVTSWEESISANNSKLRTYKQFKKHFGAEAYCKNVLPRKYRSALGKFRCGVSPIMVETGRYTNTPLHERVCKLCHSGEIENEVHVLLVCDCYCKIRKELLSQAKNICNNFESMSAAEQFVVLFENESLLYILAKTCSKMLKHRTNIMYPPNNLQ